MTILKIIFDLILQCFVFIMKLVDSCGRSYTCRMLLT